MCKFQQVFKSLYLFGAFSPLNGDHFLYTMPQCNSQTFQEYLNEFSQYKANEFKVIVLDNGSFHKAHSLKIPDNIVLVFLPPYSPELNPAEKIWWNLKRNFSNQFYESLEELEGFIEQNVRKLEHSQVRKICAFEYIFSSNFWSFL